MIFTATCLLAHWYFDLRRTNPLLASSLSLIYITNGTMVMSVILTSLMQHEYPFRKRFREIAECTLYVGCVLAVNYLFAPSDKQFFAFVASAVFYLVIAVVISVRFYRIYRTTIKRADDYYSENVGKLLKWMPIALYVTIVLVLASAILPILSSIPLISLYLLIGMVTFTYIFISLQNYMMNIAKMKMILIDSEQSEIATSIAAPVESKTTEAVSRESRAVKLNLDKWIEHKGFTKQGITLDDLALELNTNRTYLSSYINNAYNLAFRGWIALQRIEYSKELMLQKKELPSAKVAEKIGYSPNAFIKIFTKIEGMPPMQWRKENREQ